MQQGCSSTSVFRIPRGGALNCQVMCITFPAFNDLIVFFSAHQGTIEFSVPFFLINTETFLLCLISSVWLYLAQQTELHRMLILLRLPISHLMHAPTWGGSRLLRKKSFFGLCVSPGIYLLLERSKEEKTKGKVANSKLIKGNTFSHKE